ncbi:MAG TPA: pseudouridine synthase [Candidatus Eisenbacteria bacterium]
MPSTIRINVFLARAGVASRRGADRLVETGQVRVNGTVVTLLGTAIDPARDRVEVAGQVVGSPQSLHYMVMNKPTGYVTTARDPEGRPTVLDLAGPTGARLYPVGRLDMDSEGLLFLMNDGRLAFRLTHPKYDVPKTYRAWTSAPPSAGAIRQLREGLELEDGPTRPAEVIERGRMPAGAGVAGPAIDITLKEGRNRQVRRMLEAVGFPVVRLRRIRFGPIELGNLSPSEHRPLTRAEVNDLRRLVRLPHA